MSDFSIWQDVIISIIYNDGTNLSCWNSPTEKAISLQLILRNRMSPLIIDNVMQYLFYDTQSTQIIQRARKQKEITNRFINDMVTATTTPNCNYANFKNHSLVQKLWEGAKRIVDQDPWEWDLTNSGMDPMNQVPIYSTHYIFRFPICIDCHNYQKTSYDQWIPWTPIRKMSRERLKCRCKVLVIDRSMC